MEDPAAITPVYVVLTERHAARTVAEIVAQTSLSEDLVRDALNTLVDAERAFAVSPDSYLSDIAWGRVRDTARRVLTTFHKKHPYKRRAPDSELRPMLAKAAVVSDYLALKKVMEESGTVVIERGGARLPEFAVVLPPRWEAAALEMLPVFVAGGLNDPPWPGNFRAHYPRDVPVDAVLDALCEQDRLVKLEDDLYIAIESLETAKAVIRRLSAVGTPITVGTVRDATGSSRRVVVPLLEALDKQGITVRNDEVRVLVGIAPTP